MAIFTIMIFRVIFLFSPAMLIIAFSLLITGKIHSVPDIWIFLTSPLWVGSFMWLAAQFVGFCHWREHI
ncbi:TPA: hypothetical protein MYL90_002507 [Klebsiella pneumoniae]|nr:hypothetical protein [Klebsiella pneumoniae]